MMNKRRSRLCWFSIGWVLLKSPIQYVVKPHALMGGMPNNVTNFSHVKYVWGFLYILTFLSMKKRMILCHSSDSDVMHGRMYCTRRGSIQYATPLSSSSLTIFDRLYYWYIYGVSKTAKDFHRTQHTAHDEIKDFCMSQICNKQDEMKTRRIFFARKYNIHWWRRRYYLLFYVLV